MSAQRPIRGCFHPDGLLCLAGRIVHDAFDARHVSLSWERAPFFADAFYLCVAACSAGAVIPVMEVFDVTAYMLTPIFSGYRYYYSGPRFPDSELRW